MKDPEWLAEDRRKRKERAARRRKKALDAYGCCCACCGEVRPEFLTFDHVNQDGAEHRRQLRRDMIISWLRRNGYPRSIQVLCWNCNLARHIYGVCPHQKKVLP